MTRKEKQARELIIKDIMQSQNISEKKAKSIIRELENFGLILFRTSGEFGLKAR